MTSPDSPAVCFRHDPTVPTPDDPVRVALVGAGQRSQTIYRPVFASATPWVEVVAVCDPVRAHADALAERLDVPAFCDLRELVSAGLCEAALVVTPVPSHYALARHLIEHGIHVMTETTWCSLLAQARELVRVARERGRVVRVAENFFRYPKDRFAQLVRDSGILGPIRRIVTYASHTGYHNNSRWIAFARSHPAWVQCVEHTIDCEPLRYAPTRYHDTERFTARFFGFPDGLLVHDTCANVKGLLGRHPRDGYTEWQGTRGTLVDRCLGTRWAEDARMELRRCSEAGTDHVTGRPTVQAFADEVVPVTHEFNDRHWVRSHAMTSEGRLEYVEPLRPQDRCEHFAPDYATPILGHLSDFANAVRGIAASEFDEADALASMMMERGAAESALRDGARLALPIETEPEADAIRRRQEREQFGVDPMDVEAMIRISFPKP